MRQKDCHVNGEDTVVVLGVHFETGVADTIQDAPLQRGHPHLHLHLVPRLHMRHTRRVTHLFSDTCTGALQGHKGKPRPMQVVVACTISCTPYIITCRKQIKVCLGTVATHVMTHRSLPYKNSSAMHQGPRTCARFHVPPCTFMCQYPVSLYKSRHNVDGCGMQLILLHTLQHAVAVS